MGIKIHNLKIEEDVDGNTESIYTVYRYNDSEVSLEFFDESSGTQKMFSLLLYVLLSIRTGRPFFVDELDAKLHPKLLETILSLYTDPSINTNGAQLIFTSHDLHTLNSKFLRRDEIWFAARRDDFSSKLYALSDFKKSSSNGQPPRKDENYAKQYIEGRYGADPYFQRIENWTVEQ